MLGAQVVLMSKIAIIGQPNEGVLIDIGGCVSAEEAKHHLVSTLQDSRDFWQGMHVDLNLGQLNLEADEVKEIISIACEVGVSPSQVFAFQESTRVALAALNVKLGEGEPVKASITPTAKSKPVATGVIEGSQATPAVDSTETAVSSVLYLKQTLRAGQAVSHQGHLVIVGDVNPGAEVAAEGDITVWGAMRGVAHAGMNGNTHSEIRALKLSPIQIRIAHAIARSPDRPRTGFSSYSGPETARIVNGAIRIVAEAPE